MKNNFVLSTIVIMLLCTSVPIYSSNTSTPATINKHEQLLEKKEKLEILKLEKELEKLENENGNSELTFLLSILGGLLATGSFFWTVLEGIRAFRQRTNEQRLSHISTHLEQLSNASTSSRLGAVRALTMYADDSVRELLAAAETEESLVVRHAIADALAKCTSEAIQVVIDANKKTFARRAFILGRLRAITQNDAEYFHKLVGLTTDGIGPLLKHSRIYYQQAQRTETIHPSQLGDAGSEQLKEAAKQVVFLVEVTAEVISRILRENRSLPAKSLQVDLSESSLYKAKISNLKFSNSYLFNSILRHAMFENIYLKQTDMSFANFYDATFKKCTIMSSNFKNTHLRKSAIFATSFNECNFENTTFSSSNIQNSKFENNEITNSCFKGCHFDSCTFNDSSLAHCELQGVKITASSFSDNSKFFKSQLKGSTWHTVQARSAKFNGANLSNTKFENCDLRDADFSGADMSGVKFINTNITNANFTNCKNYHPIK